MLNDTLFTPVMDNLLIDRNNIAGSDEILILPCTHPEEAKQIFVEWYSRSMNPDYIKVVESHKNIILFASSSSKSEKETRSLILGSIKVNAKIFLFEYNIEKTQVEISLFIVKINKYSDLKIGNFSGLKYGPLHSFIEKKSPNSNFYLPLISAIEKLG